MPKIKRFTDRHNYSKIKRKGIYFTSHPDDLEHYFKQVSKDIFNCNAGVGFAFYHTENMSEPFSEEEMQTDIGSCSFLVVPVTKKLLTNKCRAMSDIAYAKRTHMPILPIVYEWSEELAALYSRPENFGNIQYLRAYSNDASEIAYKQKLQSYLNDLFVEEELAENIRADFKGRIFLSYRKKDRVLANELMRTIHSYERFQDISIWFDEFLTPGEEFSGNITEIMKECDLFLLMVTPSILEYVNGRPNFVLREEFPMAKRLGMPILPVEMQITDRNTLHSLYEELPDPVDPRNEAELTDRLADCLFSCISAKPQDPSLHSYYMGLAYLNGIDVEINRELGIRLLFSSARQGSKEALFKLCNSMELDVQERAYSLYFELNGEINTDLLNNIICNVRAGNDTEKRLKYEKEYLKWQSKREDSFGKRLSLETMCCISQCYSTLGRFSEALEYAEMAYAKALADPDIQNTLGFLANIADLYSTFGDTENALRIYTDIYESACRTYGKDSKKTLNWLIALADMHKRLKHKKTANELYDRAYSLVIPPSKYKETGEISVMETLCEHYKIMKEPKKELALREDLYRFNCECFGGTHPSALEMLEGMIDIYVKQKDSRGEIKAREKRYRSFCDEHGSKNSDTVSALKDLVVCCINKHDVKSALLYCEELYEYYLDTYGRLGTATLDCFYTLCELYEMSGMDTRASICTNELLSLLANNDTECAHLMVDCLNVLLRLSAKNGEKNKVKEIKAAIKRAKKKK